MTRIAPIDPDYLTDHQQTVFDQIAGGKRGRVHGPFTILLRSPGLAACVEQVGSYIRYESSLPANVRELAILVVARHWFADVEWRSHSRHALAAGVAPDTVDAIGRGETPALLAAEERAAYDFTNAVLEVDGLSRIPDAVFEAACAAFDEEGMLDLAGLAGYYSLLAKIMNTFELRAGDADIPWRRAAAAE